MPNNSSVSHLLEEKIENLSMVHPDSSHGQKSGSKSHSGRVISPDFVKILIPDDDIVIMGIE
jgi:hypothetical protein